MTRLTGGEAIVHSLIAQGVDTLFGLPGIQNDHLYAALYDQQDKIRVIHSRHEQGVAYMALGYALSTGKVGAYSVVPGVGFLNTTAALATAYTTNARVLALVGQIATDHIGRGFGMLHETPNQMGVMRSLTKWAARINAPAEAPGLVAQAFQQMNSGRPRPVGLECALDVLAAKSSVNLNLPALELPPPPVDSDAIDRAAQLLGKAKNPLIFVGSGAIEAAEDVQRLAEMLQAPVVSGGSGGGILSSRHYLSIRQPLAYQFWEKADVVLAIGSRLHRPMLNWGHDSDLKVIRIDIDPQEHNRISAPTVGIVARSQEAVPVLIAALEKYLEPRSSRQEEMQVAKAQFAQKLAHFEPQMSFIRAIRDVLPEDGLFVDEMTQVGYIARYAMPIYQPRTYITCGYQGTLGYGFSTALGVKVAHPEKQVVSVNGDGGFMFGAQELATAVQHGINTVTIVFNDNAYGNVRGIQKRHYGNRVIASELQNPNFVKMAESFGALGIQVQTPDELRRAVEEGFSINRPTLIEVPVGEMPSSESLFMLPKVRPRRA